MTRVAVMLFACLVVAVPAIAQVPATQVPGVPTAFDGSVGREDFSPSVPTPEAAAVIIACDGGDMAACYELGNRHHGGDGVARDHVASIAWIRHACEGGHAPACYDLGVRHLLGEYVDQDPGAAIANIRRACDGGHGVACFYGATLLRDGVGIPRALGAAHELMERACGLGYGPACDAVVPGLAAVVGGEESALPEGAPERVALFARMCDHGLHSGCAALADAWAAGDGVAVDAARALRLRRDACNWGHLGACTALGPDR